MTERLQSGRGTRVMGTLLSAGIMSLIWCLECRAQAVVDAGHSQKIGSLSSLITLPTISGEAQTQLELAETFLTNGDWSEAVEMLQRASDEHGRELISLPHAGDTSAEITRYIPLARYVHWKLCSLPPEQQSALVEYRRRVDGLAGEWLRSAEQTSDPSLLRRIIQELFPSTYGDDALSLLGEIELEAGNHTSARRYWQALNERSQAALSNDDVPRGFGSPLWLLVPETPSTVFWERLGTSWSQATAPLPWLAYPDSDLSAADVQARLTLVSILEGSFDRAARELQILRNLYPGARGLLRGKEVDYLEYLSALDEQSRSWPRPPRTAVWSTFGGDFQRGRLANGFRDISPTPVWRIPMIPDYGPSVLDRGTARLLGLDHPGPLRGQSGELSIYPAVAVGKMIFSEGNRLRMYDLAKGENASPIAADGEIYPAAEARPSVADIHRVRLGVPRTTVSVAGARLLARLGRPSTIVTENVAENGSYLVGIDLATQKLEFRIEAEDDSWTFDGTPIGDDARIYTVLRRNGVTPQLHVACYGVIDGKLIWRTQICAAETIGHGQIDEITHTLLSRCEDRLYLNTNMGAVAALDVRAGGIRWLMRYPRRGWADGNVFEPAWHALRDPNPCLIDRGMVYVAPSDSEHIFALDATSGHCVWQSQLVSGSLDATQLLGVAGSHLIAAGRRLWWFDRETGRPSSGVHSNPFPASFRDSLGGLGRGVLAGNAIIWPARGETDSLFFLDQMTGALLRQPFDLRLAGASAGHLVAVDGRLIVAGAEEIVAFEITP